MEIFYFERKGKELGFNNTQLAEKAWPHLQRDRARDKWKRLRGKAGYEKRQKLAHDDFVALCHALGLEEAKTLWEIEQLKSKA